MQEMAPLLWNIRLKASLHTPVKHFVFPHCGQLAFALTWLSKQHKNISTHAHECVCSCQRYKSPVQPKVHLHQLVGLFFGLIFLWFCLFCSLYKHQLTVLWLKWDLSAIGWAKWVDSIELVYFPRAEEEFICLEITSLKLLVALLSALRRRCFPLRDGSATSQTNGTGTRAHLLEMTHTLAFIVTVKKTHRHAFSRGSSSISGKKTSISSISGICTQVSAAGMRSAPSTINCHTLRAFYLFFGGVL